ncbi:MAG: HNH endonuclease [Ignavibacteriae bacterium]|nr:HNH endonuclease [Ignavibacteriota bacterium]
MSNGRVLILNQSYEPVSVCSAKKAIILIFLTKAEIVAKRDGKLVRSINLSMPFPSVIRLARYIKVPFKKIELSRRNILKRDGFRCQYCGTKSHELTIDHIIPKSRGGSDSWDNLVSACKSCNNKKADRTPEEAGIHLIKRPRRPHHILFITQYMGKVDENWKPFLFME